MSKVTGIFDQFHNLDLIPTEDIQKLINFNLKPKDLENALANRILYPQVVPETRQDLEIDLAILNFGLKQKQQFYDQKGEKLLIPASFIQRIPDLVTLSTLFVNAFRPKGVCEVVLAETGQVLGTIIIPKLEKPQAKIRLVVKNKQISISKDQLINIPCPEKLCLVSFQSEGGKIANKTEGTMQVSGGELGIVIDGRWG